MEPSYNKIEQIERRPYSCEDDVEKMSLLLELSSQLWQESLFSLSLFNVIHPPIPPEKPSRKLSLSKVLDLIGLNSQSQGEYDEFPNTNMQTLDIVKNSRNVQLSFGIHHNIGMLHLMTGGYDRLFEWLIKPDNENIRSKSDASKIFSTLSREDSGLLEEATL